MSGCQSLVASLKSLSLDPYVLFIIYIIDDIDLGLNSFMSKFAGSTKIGNAVLSGDRCSLQEDLCKISDWSVKWEIPFNINKCLIL